MSPRLGAGQTASLLYLGGVQNDNGTLTISVQVSASVEGALGRRSSSIVVRPGCQAALEALVLTPLRSAMVLSLVFAAFSSFRLVVRKRTTSSWPSSSAQAISVP